VIVVTALNRENAYAFDYGQPMEHRREELVATGKSFL
jgi:hypothetical protein